LSKKTCQLIIDSGNDYVIAVKGNQKDLYRQLRLKTENTPAASRYIATERTRNRVTTRKVQVFHDLTGISHEWIGLKSLIKVERTGTRGGKHYHQVAYYISSLVRDAVDFAEGIRGHWGIENRLHWVKDVVFDEDRSTIHTGQAPANLSLLRAIAKRCCQAQIALNLLRRSGYSSITCAQRFLANDIDKILALVE
jgi:predicted transposase YbfD/YdcC